MVASGRLSEIRHGLAIDLSDLFQSAPGGRAAPRRHWGRFPSRLARNAEWALRLLDRHGARATFFIGDWVAMQHAELIRSIVAQGHEVAAAANRHDEVGAAIASIESASRQVVQGWRPAAGAPGGTLASGLRYVLAAGLTRDWGGQQVVAAGGYFASGEWLRMMPDGFVSGYVNRWAAAAAPQVFSFRVWELDPEPLDLASLSAENRFRAHRNLPAFGDRFDRLAGAVSFVTLRERLGLASEPSSRTPVQSTSFAPAHPPVPDREPVSIVVPCFNEEPSLAYLSKALAELDAGLGGRHPLTFVLIDDGSTDDTWAEMQRLFAGDRRFLLLRHQQNRGIAAAIHTGICAASADIVAVMDSDCSYDPARIEEMLPLLEPDVALVTASPYHAQGGVEGVPEWRLFLSRGASWLYGGILRNKLATYTSCFRVCRRSSVAHLVPRHAGYIGVVEMLARLDREGWRIVEHPVVLEARLLGRSKLKIVRVVAQHLRFLAEISLARFAAWARRSTEKAMR